VNRQKADDEFYRFFIFAWNDPLSRKLARFYCRFQILHD